MIDDKEITLKLDALRLLEKEATGMKASIEEEYFK
jgi:hypothetical protein